MNKLKLTFSQNNCTSTSIQLPGSKSESNRWLILQQFFPEIQISNLANADDTLVLQQALKDKTGKVNIGHAGTAMRFLTAFYAANAGNKTKLYGSKRMHQRPIGHLVNALKQLGAEIDFIENDGFPPLSIKGQNLEANTIDIRADQSSQFISALLLISPGIKHNYKINFLTTPTSKTYIYHTCSILELLGYQIDSTQQQLKIRPPQQFQIPANVKIESDWSAASYLFSWVALSQDAKLNVSYLKSSSYQADKALPEIFSPMVDVNWKTEGIEIRKSKGQVPDEINLDLNDNPDIAQTLAVTCLGLKINCHITGLHTLRIKETDRLMAMKTELEKFNAIVSITDDSLTMIAPKQLPKHRITISTYDDHRMAMAFAALAQKTTLLIENPQVVAKSYPDFWRDFSKLGLQYVDS